MVAPTPAYGWGGESPFYAPYMLLMWHVAPIVRAWTLAMGLLPPAWERVRHLPRPLVVAGDYKT